MKTIFWFIALFLLCKQVSFADGGTLVLRKEAGPLTVSVFSSPEQLRVGPADLSVLVQKSDDKSSVLDANVKLRLTHSSAEGISEVFAPATHANATNKLLYAAHVNIPSQGTWKLIATIDSKPGNAEVGGAINVLPPQPAVVAYWPYFAVVPLIILLFALNQWLKSKRKTGSPQARA